MTKSYDYRNSGNGLSQAEQYGSLDKVTRYCIFVIVFGFFFNGNEYVQVFLLFLFICKLKSKYIKGAGKFVEN